uniref:MADF domain-containing protein n=1 Tax=Meloidogyne incognita TaxID=6306 RepID=A0A914LEF9_MELIC
MSNWNDLSRERLIQEYKKYPCLWSSRDEDIKNVEKRRECLNLITTELNKYEERPFSQDEIRTQFKNLRDMYRRKRKRLQSQQEINPGVVLDEPGWIYFNRLKFLDDATTTSNADFGLPNESPSSAPSLPPPKKKGKIVDDSSLPTPLETDPQPPENSKSILVPVKIERATTTDKEQLILSYSKDEQQIKLNFQHNVEESNNNSKNSSSSLLEPLQKHQQQPENINNSDALNKVYSTVQQTPLDNLADAAIASFNHTSTSKNNNELLIEQPRHISYIPCEDSNTNNDEFTCFGRFIAVTLRKMAAHSALDALEARKAIGDVLYGAELRSLQKQ